MRRLTDAVLLAAFMRRLGEERGAAGRVYFTGGATAVLMGWRSTTIDIDIKLDQDAERLLQAIPLLKEELRINVELASPDDFIPELPGWRDRSLFIAREGSIDFFHYDFYAQALAKLERAHTLDLADVGEMMRRGLVDRGDALRFFGQIEPFLYRYPAIDPPTFRRQVEETLGQG
jgi:hypothetical protein